MRKMKPIKTINKSQVSSEEKMVTLGSFLLILSLNCLLIPIVVLGQDEEEDVQLCAAFVEQFEGSSCSCDSSSLLCTCNAGGQGNVTVSDPCLAALGLSDVARNGQVLRLLQFPPPGGIDMTSHNVLLGRLTGDEEPMFHLRLLPMRPQDMNTRFTFYRRNVLSPVRQVELNYNDLATISSLVTPGQDALTKVYVIAHDFNQRSNIRSNRRYVALRDRLLEFTAMSAVILVDWSRGARGAGFGRLFDGDATVNTLVVGREVGLICYQLVINGVISERDIHLIGNGLGAQMLHFAAKWYTQLMRTVPPDGGPAGSDGPVRKVGRLTALDPTAKDFQGYLSNDLVVSHVFRFDAHFVDAIHTSCVLNSGDRDDSFAGRLGMSIPVGFVDFYPNGGVRQPPCKEKFLIPALRIGRTARLPFTRCHHQSALRYFIATVTRDQTIRDAMVAYSRASWFDFEAHTADDSVPRNRMGIDADPEDRRAGDGLYMLPLYIDLNTYEYKGAETRGLTFDRSGIRFKTSRVIHPNFVEPPLDSGQIIRDFPPLKPTTVTPLTAGETPLCGLFRSPVEEGARIVVGHTAFRAQFPWTVCILRHSEDGEQWLQLCTGALLNRVWVLTAAHCWGIPHPEQNLVQFAQGRPFYLVFGATNCLEPPRGLFRRFAFQVQVTVFFHPSYSLSDVSQRFDYALIKLFSPINLPEVYTGRAVNSACWKSASQFAYDCNQEVYFPGFGTKGFGRNDNRLTWMSYRPAASPGVATYAGGSSERTDLAWPGFVRFKNYEGNTLRSTCQGDSGGAFLWYVRTKEGPVDATAAVSPYRAVVVATLTAGTDCDNPEVAEDGTIAYPAVAQRIGHAQIQSWLQETMDRFTVTQDQEPAEYFEAQYISRPLFDRARP